MGLSDFEISQKELGSDADDVLELFQEAQAELDGEFFIQIDQPGQRTGTKKCVLPLIYFSIR